MNDNKNEQDKLLDHDNDGIKEYDNDLPRWWVQLFWLTGIVGVILAVRFHAPMTLTPDERLAEGLAAIEKQKAAVAAKSGAGDLTDESLLALLADPKRIEAGKAVYMGKCIACHAPGGQGLVGPNLVDNYWIHGNTPLQIKRVIEEGVIEKGMLAWKNVLKPDEIVEVVAFVWSLKGTNPPNQKAPEGQEYK